MAHDLKFNNGSIFNSTNKASLKLLVDTFAIIKQPVDKKLQAYQSENLKI